MPSAWNDCYITKICFANAARFACAMLMLGSADRLGAQAMQEVIVYSSLTEQTLANTAASITIFDAKRLSANNAQHIEHILNAAPNVNFSGGAARARFVQMRGIGDIEQFVDPKAYPSVGLSLDGIDFSGLFGAGLLFDTQQVEVLRGPQGTRLGASALAGSINIISNTADSLAPSFVEAGVGKFASRQLGGAGSIKLTENTGARLAARQYRSDGYIENKFLGVNDTARQDEFTAKLNINNTRAGGQSTNLTAIHIDNDNGYDAFSLKNTGLRTQSDQPGNDKQRISAIAVKFLQPVLQDGEIEYQLSALRANTLYSFDEDWTDPSVCDAVACNAGTFFSFDQYRRDRNDYTAEIKLSNSQYLAGFFAQQKQIDLHRNRSGDAPLQLDSRYQARRFALFGQLSPQLNESLNLELGARYEWFDDDYSDSTLLASDSRDELWQLNASLKYSLSDQARLYLLASRGNKAGGVNTDASSSFSAATPATQAELSERLRFSSESLSNYEVGAGFSNREDTLSGNISLFYNYRSNPQYETFLQDFPAGGFLFIGYQANADSAESHGAEIQFATRLSQYFLLEYAASYMKSRVSGLRVYDFDAFRFENIDHKEQPRAPSYRYHVAATVNATRNIAIKFSAEGRDSYQYAYYFNRESGHMNLLHASIQYSNEKISITGWLRNLRDERYPVQGLYFGNDPREDYANDLYTQAGEPRNGGVTFRYNF
ncbi:MAG: TonB-dependent receptor [Pseudomonadales bacterium]|nr:TonB-dependent receptor [Pseudomonadales bacterium]